MAHLSPDDGYLTVLNLFDARDAAAQDRLLEVMRDIIDNADYPGWISSTLHSGQAEFGTANYIQWRSAEDLQARYAGDAFRHRTVPLFDELSTSVTLLKTEVVAVQHHAGLPTVEIGPDRDDHTVIVVMRVRPEDQEELVELLARPDEWLREVPGYRSHSILRGTDRDVVVTYAQWDSKQRYDTFHELPEDERPADVQKIRARARELVTARHANTHRVVHTRSAAS